MSFSNKLIKTLLVPKNDNKISFKIPSEDFIPFVCHYDEETILTKNGELMKTIRITGFSQDSTSDLDSVREVVRKSIINEINPNRYKNFLCLRGYTLSNKLTKIKNSQITEK